MLLPVASLLGRPERGGRSNPRPRLEWELQSSQADAFGGMKHKQKSDAAVTQKWVWTRGKTLCDVKCDHKGLDFQAREE